MCVSVKEREGERERGRVHKLSVSVRMCVQEEHVFKLNMYIHMVYVHEEFPLIQIICLYAL